VNFVLAYYQVEYCTAWAPAFKIVNTGSMTLQSYRIKTKDNATKNTKTMTNDFFDKAEGCSVEKNVSSISYGQVGFIYSETFSYDPTGNPMTATITACTKDDLAGKCASEVVNFNP
jgi:hypothetical protein